MKARIIIRQQYLEVDRPSGAELREALAQIAANHSADVNPHTSVAGSLTTTNGASPGIGWPVGHYVITGD